MRRRDFLGALGGAAAAWPLAARAQQPAMPVIGFVRLSLANSENLVAALREGLKEMGFYEGRNFIIERGDGEGDAARLPSVVAALIGLPVDIIVGDTAAAEAAKAISTTVPALFASGGDPIRQGLVASLNRPSGNVTGVLFLAGILGAKRLDLLRQLVPGVKIIGVLVNPNRFDTEGERRDIQSAALALGQQLVVIDVNSDDDVENAFAAFVQQGCGALLVGSGVFTNTHRQRIVALAARHKLPAAYPLREFAVQGGLMSYAASITDAYRQMGVYCGRILKGEKPADLPVIQSNKIEFVINLKTAKALGLEFHPQVLATADEVIE